MTIKNPSLIPPRVDFIDERTGKIAAPWYLYLLNLGNLTIDSGGANDLSVEVAFNNDNTSQVEALQKQIDNLGGDDGTDPFAVTGTVRYVHATAPSGVLSVGGVPYQHNGTITHAWAGTSGGVPYFSGAASMASSALLAQYSVIVGGGAGAAPNTSANFTFNGTTVSVPNLTDSALTSGRVTYAGASGILTDSANLTFSGTLLTVTGAASVTGQSIFGGITSSQIGDATVPQMYLAGGGTSASTFSIGRFSAAATGPSIRFWKSRGTAVGSYAAVQANDPLGSIEFYGDDGTDTTGIADASWGASAASAPVGTVVPTYMSVFTTNLAGTRAEKLRIGSELAIAIPTASRLYWDGVSATGDTYTYESAANTLDDVVGGVNVLRRTATTLAAVYNADSDVALFGHTASIAVGGSNRRLEINGLNQNGGGLSITRWSNNNGGAALVIAKSRGATINTRVSVVSGDSIGSVSFHADDGTNLTPGVGQIQVSATGTISTGIVPGDMRLFTSNAAGTLTEGFRLNSAQNIGIVSGNRINLDGLVATGDTYITESAANTFDVVVGGTNTIRSTATAVAITGTASVSGTSTLTGNVGVGGASNAQIGLFVQSSALTGASQFGAQFTPTGTSASTGALTAVYARPNTAAAAYTTLVAYGFFSANPTKGAGSAITSAFGYYADNISSGVNNYGYYSTLSAGTGKWNAYMIGTAPNYFNGNLQLGSTTETAGAEKLQVTGAASISTTLLVTGDTTLTGDLAVNGGDLTTSQTTFNLLNATATTLNVGGAATTLSVGAATGTLTVNNTTLAAKAITASTTLGVTGITTLGNKLYPSTDAAATQSVAGMYAGNGAPNNANGANGDFYFRGDGTQAGNTVIYHKEAGAWVALVTT